MPNSRAVVCSTLYLNNDCYYLVDHNTHPNLSSGSIRSQQKGRQLYRCKGWHYRACRRYILLYTYCCVHTVVYSLFIYPHAISHSQLTLTVQLQKRNLLLSPNLQAPRTIVDFTSRSLFPLPACFRLACYFRLILPTTAKQNHALRSLPGRLYRC